MKKTKAEQKCELLTQLVAALDEYIAMLGEELAVTAPMATHLGWESHNYQVGKKMRQKIKALRKKIAQ